jgi:hypothetical protein
MLHDVTIGYTVEGYASDSVEADSPEEAAEIAMDRYTSGDWNPGEICWDCCGDDRIVHIREQQGNDFEIPEEFDGTHADLGASRLPLYLIGPLPAPGPASANAPPTRRREDPQ